LGLVTFGGSLLSGNKNHETKLALALFFRNENKQQHNNNNNNNNNNKNILFVFHLSANPELFMSGKVSADDRHVLFTKWVDTAWQETSRRLKDTVIRSFVKCGIALPISGSRDSEINIDGLPVYCMGESADVEEIEFFFDSGEES